MLSAPRTFRIFCEERFSKNLVLLGPRSRTTPTAAAQTFDRSLFSRYWAGNRGIPETSRRTHKQAGKLNKQIYQSATHFHERRPCDKLVSCSEIELGLRIQLVVKKRSLFVFVSRKQTNFLSLCAFVIASIRN
jgi:hypothetical protein